MESGNIPELTAWLLSAPGEKGEHEPPEDRPYLREVVFDCPHCGACLLFAVLEEEPPPKRIHCPHCGNHRWFTPAEITLMAEFPADDRYDIVGCPAEGFPDQPVPISRKRPWRPLASIAKVFTEMFANPVQQALLVSAAVAIGALLLSLLAVALIR